MDNVGAVRNTRRGRYLVIGLAHLSVCISLRERDRIYTTLPHTSRVWEM